MNKLPLDEFTAVCVVAEESGVVVVVDVSDDVDLRADGACGGNFLFRGVECDDGGSVDVDISSTCSHRGGPSLQSVVTTSNLMEITRINNVDTDFMDQHLGISGIHIAAPFSQQMPQVVDAKFCSYPLIINASDSSSQTLSPT